MTATVLSNRDNFHSPFNYIERRDELKLKLREFEQRMGLSQSAQLAIDEFAKSPSAQLNSNIVNVPSWYLFKYEDIPARFRIRDIDDPRLTDRAFLNEAANWLNGKIREAGLSSVCKPADHGILQIVLKLMRDPEQYEKAKEFTLGHELAHLSHSQCEQHANLLQTVHETVSIGGVMAGLFLLFLAVSIIPVVHLAVVAGVGALSIAVTIGGIAAWLNKPQQDASPTSVEEEKKADLEAVAMLGDARGGIYSFSTHLTHNLAVRRGLGHGRGAGIDDRGNNLRDKNHPPLTERVAYLRQWQSEHVQRA